MRKKITLILLLLSYLGFSQSSQLVDNTWYLNKLVLNGIDNFPPVNSSLPYVSLTVSNNFTLTTHVCNSGFGEIDYLSDSFSFSQQPGGFYVTLMMCTLDANNVFENIYLNNYFMSNADNPFSYSITEVENGLSQLIITNAQNNQAVYYNQNLSSRNFEKKSWSLYPNPVKEIMNIQNVNSENTHVEIYDMTGKLCLTKSLSSQDNAVFTGNLAKGIYMIRIREEDQTFTSKFIKE